MRCVTASLRRGCHVAVIALFCAGVATSDARAAEPDEAAPEAATGGINGFSLDDARVPRPQLSAAGPPRDAIPRVDAPEFADLEEARRWVGPATPVVGVVHGGIARAYPVHLLEHHMIVNDEFGATSVLVSYDPLTSSPRAYLRTREGAALRFGFSGILFSGGMVLYAIGNDTLFAQFDGRPLTGASAAKLTRVEARQLTMAAWVTRHPETTVLRRPLLKEIDYRYSPYQAYWISEKHPPVSVTDDSHHPKEVVLGIEGARSVRAYLGSALTAAGGRIVDELEGARIRIAYDSDSATFDYEGPEGLRVSDAYWFAWKAFHPDTELWQPGETN